MHTQHKLQKSVYNWIPIEKGSRFAPEEEDWDEKEEHIRNKR